MNLRDRCKALYQKIQQDGMLRQGDPVQSIVEFVMSETGRAADHRLENTHSVITYFATDRDREEFIETVRGVKPGMVSKEVVP